MKDIQIKITVDELRFIKGIMHCHSQRVWDEAGRYNRKNKTQDEIAKLYIKEHFNTEDLLNKTKKELTRKIETKTKIKTPKNKKITKKPQQ